MKKLIGCVGFMMFFTITNAFAYTFYAGVNEECWLEEDGNDEYWFCGAQSESCHGIAADGDDVRHWLYRRGLGTDTFSHAGRSFVCCGGSGGGEGKFVEYTSYEVESIKYLNEEKTESCVMLANPCYNWWQTTRNRNIVPSTWEDYVHYVISDCSVPGEHVCPTGKTARKIFDVNTHTLTGKNCVDVCEATDNGYESYTSNKCIECKQTLHQGKDRYGTCVKCDKNEMFVPTKQYGTEENKRDCAGTECCVQKSSLVSYSKEDMRACFRCPQEPDILSRCFKGERTDDIKTKCRLK